ncbi:hypothetical protein MBR_05137, partial [Metarhizium brunneum ARSEF 3297]
MAAQVLDSKAALRQRGTPATLPPEYAEGDYIELGGLSTPRTSTESLPAYDEAVSPQPSSAAGLRPTHTYQVESAGHALLALPLAPRPWPIGVFAVQPDGSLGPLAYQSLRHARCSGDSVLVRADLGAGHGGRGGGAADEGRAAREERGAAHAGDNEGHGWQRRPPADGPG